MASITTVTCDLCGIEIKHPNAGKKMQVPVCFLTEQNESTYIKPYLSMQAVDLCEPCLKRMIDELPIIGTGAMGYNDYKWRNPGSAV